MNADNRSHVYDRATLLAHHDRSACVDEVESRLEVNVYDSVPLLLCHTQHESVLCYASVVHEDIDRAEVLLYLLHHLLCLCEVSSVSCIGAACHTDRLNLLACSLKACCHIVVEDEVCECDICSFLSELQCYSLTYTTCSTSDECCLSC